MLVPNAIAIVAAAKIRADEESKKGAAPETLPPVGDLAQAPQPVYQLGTQVRDILSGHTGVIVEPMQINSGDLVFMKSDSDGQTYPVRSDQLERVEAKPQQMPAPAPAPVPEAAPAPAPAAEEKKTRASKIVAESVVTDDSDERALTYGSLLEKLRGNDGVSRCTAAALLSEFGYVPGSWDGVIAALAEDGFVVLRGSSKVDVRGMLAKGMVAREIVFEACQANGPVAAETARRISAAQSGLALAKRLRAAIGENRAKLAAEKPSKPQPAGDPGPGMVWAWDSTRKDWYALPISAALRAMARKSPAESKVDKEIEQAWYKHASGYQINIMDIPKVFSEARALMSEGKSADEVIPALRDKYSKKG